MCVHGLEGREFENMYINQHLLYGGKQAAKP